MFKILMKHVLRPQGSSYRLMSTVLIKNKDKPENVTGQYFQDLVFRGRRGRSLAVGDLRKLMQKCVNETHVRYAVEAVKLYQLKGHDFNEEVNSHFVSACIRGGQPTAAATLFIKPSYRIGAWSTLTSMEKLVSALDTQKDAALLKEMFFILIPKGVKLSENTAFTMLKGASTLEGFALTDEIVEFLRKAIHPYNSESVETRLNELKAAMAESTPLVENSAPTDDSKVSV